MLLVDNTNIIIEFREILCDTTTYVVSTLYNLITRNTKNSNDALWMPLKKIMEYSDDITWIRSIGQTKRFDNPLIELYEYHQTSDNTNFDDLYYEILYRYENDSINNLSIQLPSEMKFTSIATMIKMVLKNKSLKRVIIQIDKITPTFYNLIYRFFQQSDKIYIAEGTTFDILKEYPDCDVIISRNCEIVHNITSEYKNLTLNRNLNIMIPLFLSNQNNGIFKIPYNYEILERDFHITINGIKIPLINNNEI